MSSFFFILHSVYIFKGSLELLFICLKSSALLLLKLWSKITVLATKWSHAKPVNYFMEGVGSLVSRAWHDLEGGWELAPANQGGDRFSLFLFFISAPLIEASNLCLLHAEIWGILIVQVEVHCVHEFSTGSKAKKRWEHLEKFLKTQTLRKDGNFTG